MENSEYKKLKGLERQKAYIDYRENLKFGGDSFFKIDKVVESMRDSGYRDVRKAINDIVDNSIQAEAKRIAVMTTNGKSTDKGSRERITNIAIIDDGYGMVPKMIREAVTWGGTDRHNERDGLGRFGFGLPTAAVSVTRVYEVFSRIKGDDWFRVRIDLNEIAEKSIKGDDDTAVVPDYKKETPPKYVMEYINKLWGIKDLEQGTVVLLREPDRIRSFALPSTFQRKMLQNVGLTYRHFFKNYQFFVNDVKVGPVDPLFLNPQGIGYNHENGLMAEGFDDMHFEVKHKNEKGDLVTGKISLKISYLPYRFQRDNEGSLIDNRFGPMKENNGYFIVCRSGRQIDIANRTNYQKDKDNITVVNNDRHWVIELDFDPIIDELFGITTNKQQVEIDDKLWDIFKAQGLPEMIEGFRAKYRQQAKETPVEEDNSSDGKATDSELVMDKADKVDGVKLPSEKEKESKEKIEKQAEKESKETGEDIEKVKERLQQEANAKKYKVEFTKLKGAPFYDIDRWGPQTIIKINMRHRFFTDVYTHLDARGKTAIELLFFVFGTSELEADGDASNFYLNERYDWSKKLEMRLKLLDELDPINDIESATLEEAETQS